MATVASAKTNGLLHGIDGKNQLNGLWKTHREGSVVDENGNGTSPVYEIKNGSPEVQENGVKSTGHKNPEPTTLNKNTNEEDASELYKRAVELLESRHRMRDPSATYSPKPDSDTTVPKVRAQLKGRPRLEGMKEWLKIIGYDTPPFHAIHISGTKGKGSTSTFASTLLTSHLHHTHPSSAPKTGLFISPHLLTPRERILINNIPISPSLFATSLFHIWSLLSPLPDHARPRYMQLLDLLSIHVFASQGVQFAVYETHSGGEFDSTRVLGDAVKVAGVAAIGIDHIRVLGPAIEDVAWHKGGVFSSHAKAFALHGEATVERILAERAKERDTEVEFVNTESVQGRLPSGEEILETEVMRMNCALAIKLVDELLRVVYGEGMELSNRDIKEGVRGFGLAGRFQKVWEGGRGWFLDGAHNEMAMPVVADWFARCVREGGRYVSFFSAFAHHLFPCSSFQLSSFPYSNPSYSISTNSPLPHRSTKPITLIFNNPPTKDRLAIFVQLIAHLKILSFSPPSSSSFSSQAPTINFIFLSSAKYGTLPPSSLSSSSFLSSTSSSIPDTSTSTSIPSDYLPTSTPILSSYRSVCELAYPGCRISVVEGVKEAIAVARGTGKGGSVLVTGHMVLVGEVLGLFREEGL
ncbi:folylpolyglutamate synthase protein [Rutstroemia sp. NJR-2017a BBW]|nr:folylpolyglutamate synthase protein [Rutstroemia sp. NJR-2017a BBW]